MEESKRAVETDPASQQTLLTPPFKIKPPKLHEDSMKAEKEGRRENLVLKQIPLCPTFEPTLEEFTRIGFEDYLIECEKLLPPHIGVYKVSAIYSILTRDCRCEHQTVGWQDKNLTRITRHVLMVS